MIAVLPSLVTRAADAVEEMDRPDADLRRLERTYAQFWLVNAVVSGWRRNYVRHLRPIFAASGGGSLLDIGSGEIEDLTDAAEDISAE